MNTIWLIIIFASVITSAFSDNIPLLSQNLLDGIHESVTLTIKLLGMFCFWGGITNIAEKSGITDFIAKILSPVLNILFKDIDANTKKHISLSITADMLGIGNAATPLGIKAMNSLQKNKLQPNTATDNMIMFVVMNTASVRIIPTTIAMLRSQYGCQTPFDILPCTLLASFGSLLVGITLVKLFGGKKYE